MWLRVLTALFMVAVVVVGCSVQEPSPPETGGMTGMTQPPQPTPEGSSGPAVETEEPRDDEPELGLYTAPGELPECGVNWGTEEESRQMKYADLDGDGTREALVLGKRPKKAGGSEPAGPLLGIAAWNGEEWDDREKTYLQRGKASIDGDSIAFAYDLNEDGVTELGILVYEPGETVEYRTYLYLYQALEDEIKDVLLPTMTALLGPGLAGTSDDSITLDDVTDQYPGEEIVISQPNSADNEPPYTYDMYVYGWREDHYAPVLRYASDTHFADADEAFTAFDSAEGDYELASYNEGEFDPELE